MEKGILDSITGRLDDIYSELSKYQGTTKNSEHSRLFLLNVIKTTKLDIILVSEKLKKGE